MENISTVFDAGNISGGIEVAAILLADDVAKRVTLFILELRQIDYRSPLINNSYFAIKQIVDYHRQHVVIQALTHDVLWL